MQHRFTRMITSLKSLQYAARLQKLGLWTLEERRNRADLIEVFKMAHGFYAIPLTGMFQIDTTGRTRGNSLKLFKCRCNKDIRKYFFSHRVVSKWNMLDNDSVMAKTVNGFRTKLERERTKKMGLFLDWCLLDLEAVTEFRPSCKYPASKSNTRSSAIAEGPRDASCQLKSCQLPSNSAETTYTISPDQIDGRKLEI